MRKSGKPQSNPSDPQFAAIELTAAQTDKLTELFAGLQAKMDTVVTLAEETKKNVIVLKAQQDEVVREQGVQSATLERINGAIDNMERKIDVIQTSVDAIRQSVGGATSLAKSALDAATKVPRLKKVSTNNGG